MARVITLGEFIIQQQNEFPYAKGELSRLLSALRVAAKLVNSQINKAGLVDDIMGNYGESNIHGEQQQKLDVYAHRIFIEALKARNEVCGVASEEEDSFIAFSSEGCRNGKYVVLMDPLDGSSNIDVNVSVGTIFSIYRRVSEKGSFAQLEDFMQPGRQQVAAGYIIFGSSTMMVYTSGSGVNGFTYDPSIGIFFLSHPNLRIPESGSIYSINEGHYPYLDTQIKDYIKYCKEYDPASNRPYSSRYIGSLVSDFHRNLLKGGIFMYPANSKSPNGKLRLLYECNPLAYIMEQAGGLATDGFQPILDVIPTELHQRVPCFIGSKNMVNEVHHFLKKE